MKIFAAYFLGFLPLLSFGQLFPKIPDFRDNLQEVVEIRYGKEGKSLKFWERIFRPGVLSGWEFTYQFDQNSCLQKRINTFQGKVSAEYVYQRDTTANRIVEKEINIAQTDEQAGDYLEYENFLDSSGKITKVNYTAFSAKKRSRELYQIDRDAQYSDGRLISFIRQPVNENGEISSGEKCSLFYDASGKLSRLVRKDLVSGFSTVIEYTYNQKGLPSRLSVDFLTEIQEYGKKDQIQDILFKYDSRGNWIRKYWKSDDKYLLESKRKIKYH